MEDKKTVPVGKTDTVAALRTGEESFWTKLDYWLCALHLFTLCSLAFAKPLFDVTARDAAFYVVRGSKPVDIISLIVILSLLLPAILVLLESLFRLFGRRSQSGFHFLLVGMLVSLYTAQVIKHLKVLDGYLSLSIIAVCGVCGALLYARTQSFRRLISLASPVIFLFPLFFIFDSQVGEIIAPELLTKRNQQNVAKQVNLRNKPPIVFIVMDEFPVVSLFDAQGNIDPKRFPNLAEFANTAYWFRNTATAAVSTANAVPAILTGVFPLKNKLPNITGHPQNLFTLLAADYKFNVFESATDLCPKGLSAKYDEPETYISRLRSLTSDMYVLYLHSIFPKRYSYKLPSINDKWGNFVKSSFDDSSEQPKKSTNLEEKIHSIKVGNRAEHFRAFISSINETNPPSLNFYHIMMPHSPYEYLPSTKKYRRISEMGINGITKVDDKFTGPQGLVDEYHKLHILQISSLDKLIGELIARLKVTKTFDNSLVIFVADHGVSFVSNDCSRELTNTNAADLYFVPLMMKLPNQKQKEIISTHAETVDIMPTLADVLGVKLPWKTTGTSLLAANNIIRPARILGDDNKVHSYPYSDLLKNRRQTHLRNISIFGLENKESTVYSSGRYHTLIGKSPASMDITNENYDIETDQNTLFDTVNLQSDLIPSFISGKMTKVFPVPPLLAISVNDVIQVVTESFNCDGKFLFSAIIPESAFNNGTNRVEIFAVSSSNTGKQHLSTTSFQSIQYKLSATEIIPSVGKNYQIANNTSGSHVEAITRDNSIIVIEGWATNSNHTKAADSILVFSDAKFISAAKPKKVRPDLSKAYKNKNIRQSGFKLTIPSSIVKDISKIRVFSISDDVAIELTHTK